LIAVACLHGAVTIKHRACLTSVKEVKEFN